MWCALDETYDGFLFICQTTEPHYYLPDSTESKFLDIESARESGYPVVRGKHLKATKASVLADASPTVGFILGDGYSFSDLKDVFATLRDVLRDHGYDAYLDQNSQQGNDIVIDGRKVAGFAYGGGLAGMFINGGIELPMYEHIRLPDSKFDGKLVDTVEERIGTIDEIDDSLVNDVRNGIVDTLEIDHTEEEIPDNVWVRQEELIAEMTSDDELFRL
ncbi:lipoate--protein ligase family protein [Natrialba asiatica]|uniref:Uncharacterized protein n=1 Tax=Natrialba asiatica (strain ATCC 700177 / DSM 12278 / JCM 9576 / FERM P-10747 / NBRC 102637 / 172P1) TaxID=29540 RepID=M0AQE7_NATA1|nr:lipoate--protein ligase family protein [Natrialba asiatica]ELZ00775.1 hypothetical protein C481_11090 [Natrialba asiatica DSM 12278]